MTYFSHQDGFPMVNALVYVVTHWTRPMVNHNIILAIVIIHQTTILYELSTLKRY